LVGLYGLIAFTTAQRTRDSGIRLALGARPFEVVKPLLREGSELVACGLVLGAALAMLGLPHLRHLLVGVSPWDLSTGVTALGLMIITSFLACYLPARRAAKVDPMIALRAE
jgi:ABC-type antimicrobial peptide transport system permease subunit